MPKKSGFTLIELLITIAIVAILFAIGLTTFSAVMKQGRDSKRQSDLKSLQSALEQYYADQGYYPYFSIILGGIYNGLDDILGNQSAIPFTNLIGNHCDPYGSPPCPPSKNYINSLPYDPTDPTGTYRYTYVAIPTNCDNSSSSSTCTSYCLYAKLENSSPGRPSACTNTNYNFAVTPP